MRCDPIPIYFRTIPGKFRNNGYEVDLLCDLPPEALSVILYYREYLLFIKEENSCISFSEIGNDVSFSSFPYAGYSASLVSFDVDIRFMPEYTGKGKVHAVFFVKVDQFPQSLFFHGEHISPDQKNTLTALERNRFPKMEYRIAHTFGRRLTYQLGG